jgi:small subunit ribosomal protein S1
MTSKQTKQGGARQTMDKLLATADVRLKTFRRGDVVEGTVISRGLHELYVDLGAKSEGIIGGRGFEKEFERAKTLKVDDKVLGTVIQSEDDQGYIVLSLSKASVDQAWEKITQFLESGETLEVTVIDHNKGGLVVEARLQTLGGASTLRGFVPFSHLSPRRFDPKQPESAPELLGERLRVKVIEQDRRLNRIVFSEKKAGVDEESLQKYLSAHKNKEVRGEVTAFLPYGVIVRLPDDIEALLHVKDIDWVRIEDPRECCRVGDKLRVKIVGLDEKEGKLRVSRKALKDNPWDKIAQKYHLGDTISGKVTKIVPFGAFVKLPEGIEGLIHVSETTGPLAVGEEVKVRIITLEPEKQKLGLSVKRLGS